MLPQSPAPKRPKVPWWNEGIGNGALKGSASSAAAHVETVVFEFENRLISIK